MAAVDVGAVVEDGGQAMPADLVVWAAGFAVPPIAATAGLAVDEQVRVLVDALWQSVSHPEVVAVGDAAAAPAAGGTSRMSYQTGLPMDSSRRRQSPGRCGPGPRPVAIRYVWQNISLGRHDGVTQFTHADDSPAAWS